MADVGAVALSLHGDPFAAPGDDEEEEPDSEAFAPGQPEPRLPRRRHAACPEDPEPGAGSDDEFDVAKLEQELMEDVLPEREEARAADAPQPAVPIDSEPCTREEDIRPNEPGAAQRCYEFHNHDAILAGDMPRWKPPSTSATAASVASSLAVMMSLGGVNISIHVQNRFDRLRQLAKNKEDYWALLDQSMDTSDPDHTKVKKALQLVGLLNKWRIKAPRPPSKDNYPQSAEGTAKYEAAKERYHGRLAKRETDRRTMERWLAKHFPDRGQYLKQLHQERQDVFAGIRFSNDSRDMHLAKRFGERTDVYCVEEHEARKAKEEAESQETPAKKKARLRGIAAFKRVWARVSGAPATEEQMLHARQNANKRSKTLLNPADRKKRDDERAADELAVGAASQSNAYQEMIARLEQREADHLAREQAYTDEAVAYLAERRAKKDKRDRDALDAAERRDLREAELAAARVFSSERFVIDQETGERLGPDALLARFEKARAREFTAVKRRKEARDEFYRTHIDDLASVELHIVLHDERGSNHVWESPMSLDNLRVSDTGAGSSREHAGKV